MVMPLKFLTLLVVFVKVVPLSALIFIMCTKIMSDTNDFFFKVWTREVAFLARVGFKRKLYYSSIQV